MILSYWRAWRENGWTPIDAVAYAQAWQQFGGSVATHPDVVERLAGLVGIPVRYLGWVVAGRLCAAMPTWGRHVALSKDVLKREGKRGMLDLGNAEIILPVAEDAQIRVRHRMRYVSALNAQNMRGSLSSLKVWRWLVIPMITARSFVTTSVESNACWRRRAVVSDRCWN